MADRHMSSEHYQAVKLGAMYVKLRRLAREANREQRRFGAPRPRTLQAITETQAEIRALRTGQFEVSKS